MQRAALNTAAVDSSGRGNYLAVLQTCNTLIHNLGKNLWSKYFPKESADGGKVNLQFDIEPGDSTPRRMMVCLAKQVHNFKCVAKILERVKEAEKMLQSLDDENDDESAAGKREVNLALLTSLNSQLTVLAKCESAMRQRHSVRHRVLPVEPGKVACFALCDVDCPVLNIRLWQLDSYTLLDNTGHQLWLIEDPRSGHRQRVPPLFLAVEPETAELARIGRVRTGFQRIVVGMTARLAGWMLGAAKGLRTGGQEELKRVLASAEVCRAFLYRLQMLERFLKILASHVGDSQDLLTSGDHRSLLEAIDFLGENVKLALGAKPNTAVASQLLKMQKGLGVLRTFAHAQDVSERLRHRESHGDGGSSRRSFRSGRSHQLMSPQRRTSVFEFEFEFLESTRKSSTVTCRRSVSTSDLAESTSRFVTETVTRQRQEVARKFVIQSVWNGRQEVSLQDAVEAGVVDFQRGVYVELLGSRAEMPLEAAMAAGKIRVEFVTSKQVSEDTSSFGMITVEENRQSDKGQQTADNVSYVVHAVVDVAGKQRLSFQEAVQQGLIDRDTGSFRNSATGEILPPGEAIKKGFFKAYAVDDPRSLNIDPENRITAQNINKLKSRWSAVNAFSKALRGGKDT